MAFSHCRTVAREQLLTNLSRWRLRRLFGLRWREEVGWKNIFAKREKARVPREKARTLRRERQSGRASTRAFLALPAFISGLQTSLLLVCYFSANLRRSSFSPSHRR